MDSVRKRAEMCISDSTQYERGFRQIELPAIRDLSLTVKEGEMVAVVGSSGSGKSLLAHAVLGILPYNAVTGGRIDYDGMELTEKRIRCLLYTSQGFKPVKTALKYGGYRREIFLRDRSEGLD